VCKISVGRDGNCAGFALTIINGLGELVIIRITLVLGFGAF